MDTIFNFFQQFYIPRINPLDVFEILLIILLTYQIQKNLKNTRAWVIAKGILILACIYLCSLILKLSVIETIFQGAISLSVLAAIILFEPEIKKFLEELGTKKPKDILRWINTKEPLENKRYSDKTIKEILDACSVMSDAKTGALIIIEQDSILNEYINTGIGINADITGQLLINIFEHNTPLHDGAVIIRKNSIVAATCYLPLSENTKINKNLGTRHRAGIGISEVTDALVIIVSEETGKISFVKDGILKHGVSLDSLHNLLNSYQNKVIEEKKNILQKKKDKFKRNWISKVFSVIFGCFLWIAILNSQNPLITKEFVVPVEVKNENALSEVGKTYEIENGNTASIYVTGPRSIIDEMKNEDITAYVDFNKLSYTYSVPVEAKIIGTKSDNCSIDTKNAVMQLKLDEMMERTLDLQIETNGSCRNGYCLTDITSNTKEISIQGSESQVKTIDKVIVKVPLFGKQEDFTATQKIEIYDKNGSQLNNDDFILSESEVIVNGTVFLSKIIPITVNLKNENSDEYTLLSMETDLDSVSIAGSEDDLNLIDGITIEIDVKEEQISENLIKTLNLSDYLPEGVYLEENNKRINISMKYEIYVTKDFEIDVDKIDILNLKDNLNCNFKNETFTLSFKSESEKINQLNIDELSFSLDLNQLERGNYSLPVQIQNLPDGVTLVSDGIVPFRITK